ncbi:hypothetical protein ILUMI_04918 [Ignelater luminosus]|uniref:MADF domain-containing protein n=1 Tax=Ignelater luminosus TaxID=2038154 RepID=A0A8K0D825_IGNLU|nr:hypothetical protein ILUMI_04918 [Ignelater luminosus]
MKSILSAYRREKKKVCNLKILGAGTNDIVYEPRWFAYKYMLFLHDINRSKKTKELKKCKEHSVENEDTSEREEEDVKESEGGNRGESEDGDLEILNSSPLNEGNIRSTFKKRLKRSGSNAPHKTTFEAIKSATEERRAGARDEFAAFGEVVAHKLRKLPTDQERDVVQFKINELLFKASMGIFRPVETNSFQTVSCSPYSSQHSSMAIDPSSWTFVGDNTSEIYENYRQYTDL